MLFCLNLVQALIGTSVHHDVHQDRVECHDRETTPAHGTSDGQGRDEKLSLLTSTGVGGTRIEEKDLAILKGFFLSSTGSAGPA